MPGSPSGWFETYTIEGRTVPVNTTQQNIRREAVQLKPYLCLFSLLSSRLKLAYRNFPFVGNEPVAEPGSEGMAGLS